MPERIEKIAILSQVDYDKIKPTVLPSGTVVGISQVSTDNRCAICHGFSLEDIAYLQSCGATICDEMPCDFIAKEDE